MPATEPGLAPWHDFFLLAGTAGFTLLGLLFVAVSVNSAVIMRGSERRLRVLAIGSFESLIFVVILSLVMLVPMARQRLMGGMLVTLGAVMLVMTVRHLIGSRGRRGEAGLSKRLRMRLALPAAAAVFVVMSGVQLMEGRAALTFMVLAAVLWLIVTATRNAWELLVLVGEAKGETADS